MGDLFGELALGAVSAIVGSVLGTLLFGLVRTARWALLGSERTATTIDPEGRPWLVRIALLPRVLRFPASTAFFAMGPEARRRRRLAGLPPDAVSNDEMWHPKKLLDETDEAASLVAAVLVVVTLVAIVVLAVEIVVVLVAAIAVAVVRIVWGRWRCEIVDPDGRRVAELRGSLRDVRAAKAAFRAAVAAGDPIPSHTPPT